MSKLTPADISNSYVKTDAQGRPQTFYGKAGVEVFRLRTLLSGLRFQAETGMKLSRTVDPRKIAKAEFGLKTNSFPKLIAACEAALLALESAVTVIPTPASEIPSQDMTPAEWRFAAIDSKLGKDEPREEPLLEHSFNA